MTSRPARLAPSLARALRVGALAWLVAVLATALVAAPRVAAEFDFGHEHPFDTPAHVHSVASVFVGVAITRAAAPVPAAPVRVAAPQRAAPQPPRTASGQDARPRAPPAALS